MALGVDSARGQASVQAQGTAQASNPLEGFWNWLTGKNRQPDPVRQREAAELINQLRDMRQQSAPDIINNMR